MELAGKIPADGSPLAGAEETALVRQAQGGNRAAFDSLVRQYDQGVLRLVLRVAASADEASDLFQEAFLKVYRSLGHFRFESRFSTWLYRVVTNVCLDHLRRKQTRREVQPPAAEEGQPEYFHTLADDRPSFDPERALRSKEISRRLQTAMVRLSPRERMVFELRHYEGLKLRVIGEMCGTSEETAKNCLFRATQKLRCELGDLV
ncbi:MAG TPA: sigma-70 family RNA polymerase sigma factor [Terriglobia bacterium]|nr:sigma-70 family RNA polymerase sigma factor [Terriglobia bacterium]